MGDKKQGWALLSVLLLIGWLFPLNASELRTFSQEEGQIARGRKVSFSVQPRYYLTSGRSDAFDLTDGKLAPAEKTIWHYQETVAWDNLRSREGLAIVIDLEKAEPVNRVRFFSGYGAGGVKFQPRVFLEVSEDGRSYYQLGNIMEMAGIRPAVPETYQRIAAEVSFPAVTARFVRLRVFVRGAYFCTDEIEVFRAPGGTSCRQISELQTAPSGQEFFRRERKMLMVDNIRRSFRNILMKATDNRGSQKLEAEISRWDTDRTFEEFRGIFPFASLQERLFQLNAERWRRQGHGILTVAPAEFYRYTDSMDFPENSSGQWKLATAMMAGEKRTLAVNIANPEDKIRTFSAELKGLKGKVYSVGVMDGLHLVRTAGLLLPPAGENCRIYPGLVRQLGIVLDSTGMTPGLHRGLLKLAFSNGSAREIPLEVNISPVCFPKKTTAYCGGWDYLQPGKNNQSLHGNMPLDKIPEFWKLEQEALVNTTFAYYGIGSPELSPEGKLLKAPDFRALDRWIDSLPDARLRVAFIGLDNRKTLGGHGYGTPEYFQIITAWGEACQKHLAEKKMLGKVVFQLLDEPHYRAKFEQVRDVTRAFKKGAPDIPVMITPNISRYVPEFTACLKESDIICMVARLAFARKGERAIADYRCQLAQRPNGLLWFYNASAGSFSSQFGYYRNHFWNTFAKGGHGGFFWGFSSMKNSLNHYCLHVRGPYYGLIAKDGRDFLLTKYYFALREGVQDYEYLVILQRLLEQAKKLQKDVSPVEKRMAEAVKKAAFFSSPLFSMEKNDACIAEEQRLEILQLIERVSREVVK